MAASSNRDLWQVVTGHSALRDHALIEKELKESLPQLKEGVAYYRPPSNAAEKRLKDRGKVRARKLSLVLYISSHLQLDQEQSLEIFEGYLINAHRSTLRELEECIKSDVGRRQLVEEVATYYHAERLHLLRCIKHILGYWQDPNHPFRNVYAVSVAEITKDETSFIKSLWCQYGKCVESELPTQLNSNEQKQWIMQRLAEQVELLEAILLYYKDFVHNVNDLLINARQLHKYGFGICQSSKASLVDGADILQQHIGHLGSLILVESFDLDSILTNLDDQSALADHHLFKSDSSTSIQGLDDLFSEWDDQDFHTPVLLAWALLNFAKEDSSNSLEPIRLLGNRALNGGVFMYMHTLLNSPFFAKERPLTGVCKSVVHTLLSLALTQFSEDSLGDYQDLVAIAAQTLTHPPLRLQLWEQSLSVGVGVLVNSALSHFPYSTSSLLSILHSLSGDKACACHVWQLLASLQHFTEQLPEIGKQVRVVRGEPGDDTGLVTVKPRSFYTNEAQWLGCRGIVIATGVCGDVWECWGGDEVVTWHLPEFCGWTLLALDIVRLLQTSPLGSTTDDLVTRVTETTRLVTQMLKSDWSLATSLYPITSQVFSILQRFSTLPHPPCNLLASCLSCVVVMATNNTAETWLSLSRTGFLPYLTSSITPSTNITIDQVGVAPGHYGHLLKMVECPDGDYPITMAMLDFLATTCLPSNSVVTREQLSSVVYIMREVFSSCHKWKYRLRSHHHELELKLLRLCHDTLEKHRESPYSLGIVMTTHLLSCPGERGILPLLSLPVTTLDLLHSAALGSSSVSPCVECVRLALSILGHLLHSSDSQSSLLEWNLANTYPHIVANISSYIYHHGDTRVPIAATALLTRLCMAAPFSVFSLLGNDAVAKRDTFISRLSSHVEEEELKQSILCLLREAICSQPALAELFLCINTSSSQGKIHYSLKDSSCLHPILKIISSSQQQQQQQHSILLSPSLYILRTLWHGRHDIVIHALRDTPSFWKYLTTPLLHTPDLCTLSDDTYTHLTNQLLAASHVMHIVAMEIYYVFQDKLDSSLHSILKAFVSNDGIKNWNQCMQYPSVNGMSQPLTPLLLAQHQLVIGWKTLLMVATSNQPSLFGFPSQMSPTPVPLPPSHSHMSHITHTLNDILSAIESHLTAPVSMPTVAMASELSILAMVLSKHWANNIPGPEAGDLIGQFSHVLPHVMRLDPVQASPLTLHLYTSIHLLLNNARKKKSCVETRFLLGLIPFLAHTLRCRHDNSKGPSHRPDVMAMYLLSEMVGDVSDWLPWLQAFRNESLIPLLIQMVEERLKLQTDEYFIEAILGVFIAMATNPTAAEALLVAGLLQVMSLPLCSCLDNKLNPAPLSLQHPGTPVLKPHPPTRWSSIWQLSIRVAGLICYTLSHLALPQLLDFTGVHQHRIIQALDIMEAIHSLSSLETTRSTVFFIQQLFKYRRQIFFTLTSFHTTAVSCTLTLLAATATVLSRRATLKHIIKTMLSAGLLPSNYNPPLSERGRVSLVGAESWAPNTGLHVALTKLQTGLVSILLSCLSTIQHFCPSLNDIVMATGQLDREEYPVLFQPVVTPPTLDQTTPPSLGALTTCLSVGLDLLKMDGHKIGTPSKTKSPLKSTSKSPSKSPRPLTAEEHRRQREAMCMMERSVVLCMGQALCVMTGHTHSSRHELQMMCKELANELGTACHGLLLLLNRRSSAPSSQATPPAFHEAWSGKSNLAFSETTEQIVFRITDSFIKQLLNLY